MKVCGHRGADVRSLFEQAIATEHTVMTNAL